MRAIPNASAANFIVGRPKRRSRLRALGRNGLCEHVSVRCGGTGDLGQHAGDRNWNYPFLYTYLLAGMQTETYPSGRVVTSQIDAAGRISQVADASTTFAFPSVMLMRRRVRCHRLSIWGVGLRKQRHSTRGCNRGRFRQGSLLTLTYGYGTTANNGNVLQRGDQPQWSRQWTQTYGYDGANRLARSIGDWDQGTSWYETYGYDGYGNQWLSGYSGLWTGAVTSETPQSSAWYDTSTNRISNGGSWTYDPAGNIKSVGGMARSFRMIRRSGRREAVVNGTTEKLRLRWRRTASWRSRLLRERLRISTTRMSNT